MNSNSRSGRKGQAMVELALSIPVLMLVLTGVIELSVLISHAATLQEAVNQAAKSLAIEEAHITPEDVEWRVRQYLKNDKLLKGNKLSVDFIEDVDDNGAPTISVTATLKVNPFAFTKLGAFSLNASATYRKEWGH